MVTYPTGLIRIDTDSPVIYLTHARMIDILQIVSEDNKNGVYNLVLLCPKDRCPRICQMKNHLSQERFLDHSVTPGVSIRSWRGCGRQEDSQ